LALSHVQKYKKAARSIFIMIFVFPKKLILLAFLRALILCTIIFYEIKKKIHPKNEKK